ncbi:paraquat-inducible protein A [Burkholderia territorii]|uniref:Paraquat-inducible protein A n=1 Tax=Burkholderia territorii TaxID=1503055 RepID=A0A6L3NAH1_9BURK|nr:paraquat-inducible protein A [Burkholderia territorii]KAB0655395.1 paraquat-inducible protein A [Burkholderia territorii]MBM2773597.1 paraquat-inducible protein A [Burkholderia territorii]VWB67580.1 PqiA family integral membrane protein [Burkholderia territorii]
MEYENLIACHECDLLFRRPPRLHGLVARCSRCGARLAGVPQSRPTLDRTCAMTVAALVTFLIAQSFPIMALDANGMTSHATLFDAVAGLWANHLYSVAAIVFCSTTLFPLMELVALLYLLIPLRLGRAPRRFGPVLRFVQQLRPWGMIEVFMLGVFVTIVKMASLAHVIPGTALFAFAALTLMLVAVTSFDAVALWEAHNEITTRRISGVVHAKPRTGHGAARVTPDSVPHDAPAGITANRAGLIACHTCGRLAPRLPRAADQRCSRCGSRLHQRRPDSIKRTAALLISAALLYIPANLLPIMHATSLGRPEDDTILGGVAYFWTSGDRPLAVVVFVASVMVPMLKLGILALQTIAAHRGSGWRPLERSRLYRIVELIGRWSMLDIYVVALTVALVHFGSFADIRAGAGALAFCAVVVLTMLAAMQFDPRLIWDDSRCKASVSSEHLS